MHLFASLLGCVVLAGVLLDAFQTIILPRRPVGRLRITRVFFLVTWWPWTQCVRLWKSPKTREQTLSVYGPLSLLLLFVLWALLLTTGFAMVFFGLQMAFHDPTDPATLLQHFRSCLYISGTTLFTLGLGDVQPLTQTARLLVVTEAGTGLGFIALVIGYVPVLYGAFSNREIAIALLDARAGSPPTAGELLVRHNFNGGHHALTTLLAEWERWSATMLETHVSYPILCYYRSQHDNQSWLSALTAILDACALLITTVEGPSTRQAQLTFAIARHTLIDLGHVFHREQVEQQIREAPPTRLNDEDFGRLCQMIGVAGFSLCTDIGSRERLAAIRKLYEPHACSLAGYLHLSLPLWVPPVQAKRDGWNTVAELRSPAALAERLTSHVSDQSTVEHFSPTWRS